MGENEMPAVVAPKGFQPEPGLVSLLTPILAWTLKATLGLPAGGFNGSTANGFSTA